METDLPALIFSRPLPWSGLCPRNGPQNKRQQPPTKPKSALILSGKNIIVIPDIISRKRKENIRNLRR